MKITFESDRVRMQAENRDESQALLAVHDLVCEVAINTALALSIANDTGCTEFPRGEFYNYCALPLAKSVAEAEGLCAAARQEN